MQAIPVRPSGQSKRHVPTVLPGLKRLAPVICSLAMLFSSPINAETPELMLLNDGNPVAVQSARPVKDYNKRFGVAALTPGSSKPESSATSHTKGLAGPPALKLPLRPGFVNPYENFHTIYNFVDQDENFPDSLLDYNCGSRTYDTESGLNHNGIDYGSLMYPWLTMETEGLIAVAAADGMIVDRHDGEFDQRCAFDNSAVSNRIVLEHTDGSVSIYAHLKKDTVTPRKVGDWVEAGDYLGVVGSSGFSTGPHLHLGVEDSGANLIEPFAGACNALNLETWWEDQEEYESKKLGLVATHSQQPEYPPCPQSEIPHLSKQFSPGETIYLSVFMRDFTGADTVTVEVRNPQDQVVVQTGYSDSEIGHAGNLSIVFGITSDVAAPSGAYTFSATYDGNTKVHVFYLNAGPPPVPVAVEANNAYNGLWYDPDLDGEGYNVVTTSSGTIVYFYGSDIKGNRVWLISDLLPGPINSGQSIEIAMYESTGGVFASPVSSVRGLSRWGKVIFVFTSCTQGTATLEGVDGSKVSNIVKLAGVAGTNCTTGAIPSDAAWSGLWFDPADDGEGYNLLVAPVGSILYFYGFKTSGLRLWLISDLITDVLAVGIQVVVPVFEATQGVFSTPVNSSDALVQWGTATITVQDCSHITIVLTGTDGTKTSNTILLAGIIGITCS